MAAGEVESSSGTALIGVAVGHTVSAPTELRDARDEDEAGAAYDNVVCVGASGDPITGVCVRSGDVKVNDDAVSRGEVDMPPSGATS
jgi:hypothetical protein